MKDKFHGTLLFFAFSRNRLTYRIFPLLIGVLLMSFCSCTSYMNINSISSPLTLGNAMSDTLSWNYFEGMKPGDKIRIKDKSEIKQDILFSSASEGMLYGLALRNPVSWRKVEPFDYSMPINRISQIRVIEKSSEIANNEIQEFYMSELYRIKEGNEVFIEKKNGQHLYMFFKEFKDGVVYGDAWGSIKNEPKSSTEKVEIPISEIEKIEVKKFNSKRTGLLFITVGVGFLAVIIISYATNPIYFN